MAKSTKQSALYGSKAKAERVDRSLRRRAQMYALMAEHPESAEELAQRVADANKSAPMVDSKFPRAVRKAEAAEFDRKRATVKDAVEDAGTGQTIIKFNKKAIERLIERGEIANEEMRAAAEIETAIHALSCGLRAKGAAYERVDCSRSGSHVMPDHVAYSLDHYGRFAAVWTQRHADYGDPTLEILIDAVVDEMTLSAIHQKHGYRLARVEKALIGGLRDYAARAGFVTSHKAAQWQEEAASVFGAAWLAAGAAHQGPAEYRKAVRRAAVER